MHMHMHMHMHVHVHMHMHMHVTCMRICTCMHMHIHVHMCMLLAVRPSCGRYAALMPPGLRDVGCTFRGYAGCMCRIPLAIEAACAEATGAACHAANVGPASCPGTNGAGGRVLSESGQGQGGTGRLLSELRGQGVAVTKMTLVVTSDASVDSSTGDPSKQ